MTKFMKTTRPKTKSKRKTKPKNYLEYLEEEKDKIFRRRYMKSSEELLQVFSTSHSPHKQLKPASSDESDN